jgi:hypothetical protein
MATSDRSNKVLRNKYILLIIWIISFSILITCYVFVLLYPGQIPIRIQIPLLCVANIAAGFFFPITISKIIEFIRDQDIATVIWNFSSECSNAGLLMFYSSRKNEAESALERSFSDHKEGDILMVGPSLRLFLAPGLFFHEVIKMNLMQYERNGVKIRAVFSHLDKSRSLPIRAFVEEFNPDGMHPKGGSRKKFNWQSINFDDWDDISSKASFDLEKFCQVFYDKYGKLGKEYVCRCIGDLQNVQIGLNELNSKTKSGKVIEARKTICAPYCTAIIFPHICYFTPNLLYHSVPVDMPMLSFLRGGPPYDKILDHFKFVWWTGNPCM